MSRVEAVDAAVTSIGTKVGGGATGATAVDPRTGEINVTGTLIGVAQGLQGLVDLGTKGMQAVPGSTWSKAVPGVGSVLGFVGVGYGLYQGPKTNADYAGIAANTAAVFGGAAMVFGAPALAAGLTVVGIGAAGYQIYSAVSDKNHAPQPGAGSDENYSNEGRNYTKVNYGFGPGYRGAGFSDPRLGTSPSSTASAPTFSVTSSWAKPDYSLVTAANLPVAREALNNLAAEDSFRANYMASLSKSYDASGLTPEAFARTIAESAPKNIDALDAYASAYHAAQEASTPAPAPEPEPTPAPAPQYSGGGRSGSSGGGWGTGSGGSLRSSDGSAVGTRWPIVIDLDGDGVELRPLSNSSTYFDLDNDGFAERTAWAGADDGLLMIDLGADGKVTDVKEISFAEWTPEQDTDLQALGKVFDFGNISVAVNDASMRRCA